MLVAASRIHVGPVSGLVSQSTVSLEPRTALDALEPVREPPGGPADLEAEIAPCDSRWPMDRDPGTPAVARLLPKLRPERRALLGRHRVAALPVHGCLGSRSADADERIWCPVWSTRRRRRPWVRASALGTGPDEGVPERGEGPLACPQTFTPRGKEVTPDRSKHFQGVGVMVPLPLEVNEPRDVGPVAARWIPVPGPLRDP